MKLQSFKIFLWHCRSSWKKGIIIEFEGWSLSAFFSRIVIRKKEFTRPKLIFMKIQTDLCNPSLKIRKTSVVLFLSFLLCEYQIYLKRFKTRARKHQANSLLQVFYHHRGIFKHSIFTKTRAKGKRKNRWKAKDWNRRLQEDVKVWCHESFQFDTKLSWKQIIIKSFSRGKHQS